MSLLFSILIAVMVGIAVTAFTHVVSGDTPTQPKMMPHIINETEGAKQEKPKNLDETLENDQHGTLEFVIHAIHEYNKANPLEPILKMDIGNETNKEIYKMPPFSNFSMTWANFTN